MKKLLLALLSALSIQSFANTIESGTVNNYNLNNLECHCEKHKMIFEIKDNESITEMKKHCLINESKTQNTVKFVDDNSGKQIKCDVKNDKLIIKSCKEFNHADRANYKKSSKITASTYNDISSKNN
ncbi:MAG: hypothetical protein PHC75_07350 [Burkholderiales bacterium]|nr:hypothetical protein [Burkholderiales bacterium]